MKKIIFTTLAVLFLTFTAQIVHAQDRGFGIGVILGEPTGISAKYWIGERSAFDFGLGVSIGGDRLGYNGNSDWNRIHIHADYLYHFFDVIGNTGRIPIYFGTGPRLNFAGDYGTSFGWRGVAGVDWLVEKLPIDVFAEVAPVFQVGHETGLGLEGGVGVRYFF